MGRLTVVKLPGGGPDLARDALRGLSSRPKSLPPAHFYDAAGSRLFEGITRAPEYYITRTELGILRRHADEIVAGPGGPVTLVELGSGSSLKTRVLIEALLARQRGLRYIAIDVSRAALLEAARGLMRDYPDLRVTPCVGDYGAGLAWLRRRRRGRTLALSLGSSIGNLDDEQARSLLRATADLGCRVVLGADLRKDRAVLEAAYNDAAGLTARFNLNLLLRINAELGGRFQPGAFRHRAFYEEREGRIEMHLESARKQEVAVEALGRTFRFARGERIHTEDSRKYTLEQLDALAARAGLRVTGRWLDERRWFSVVRLERGAS
jgi:dimethylhistidine N-methyltransferase